MDILEIDRSFVDAIHRDEQAPAIVHGLLELARTLGLDTIAEGIETEAQRDSLSQDGCELGQGYLFGKPRDERVTTELLERQWRFDRRAVLDRTSSS